MLTPENEFVDDSSVANSIRLVWYKGNATKSRRSQKLMYRFKPYVYCSLVDRAIEESMMFSAALARLVIWSSLARGSTEGCRGLRGLHLFLHLAPAP